jgi:hypothetical protein
VADAGADGTEESASVYAHPYRVCLRVFRAGKETDVSTTWPTRADACNEIARILVGPEFSVCTAILDSGTDEQIERLLDFDGDLKAEHCFNEKLLRDLIGRYLNESGFDFQISNS